MKGAPMSRRTTAVLAAVAAAALLVAPADAVAKKKGKPRPVTLTQYLNWGGDCAGAGFLSLKHIPNPDSCALYFPGLADTYFFGGAEGLPMALDATRPVTVDFTLSNVATAAADFEAVLSATVAGDQVELASASVNVPVAPGGSVPVHFDLEPSADFDKATVTGLNLQITWSGGVTYSSIDLDSGTARMVVRGFK
jgi:hypothetical protein